MNLLKRVYRILTPRQHKLIVILCGMMLVGAAFETIGTSLILPLITAATAPEAIEGNKYMRWFKDLIGLENNNDFLIACVILLIIVYVVKNVYLFIMYYAQYRFVYNGQYNTSRSLFKEYVNRPYEYYLNSSTPVAIRNIVSDVNGSYQLVLTILQLATELVVFACLLVLSIVVNPIMTLLMALFILVVLLINKRFFGPLLRSYGNQVNQNNAMVTKSLLQAMDGMKETKVLHKERYFVEQYETHAGILNAIQMKQSTLSNIPRLSVETVVMVGILTMLGIFLGRNSQYGIGSMIAQVGLLAMVAVRMMPSANRVITAINNLEYYEPSLKAVEDLIVHAHEINTDLLYVKDSPMEIVTPLEFRKEVKLESISYRYPMTDVDIFHDASLTVPIGKSIGIIGPSGAGKSTAVDILLGLLRPQSGKITVDGVDIQENLPGWYADVGYVPQMMFMLDDTIRNNVAYGMDRDKISEERVWECLKEAQMDEFVRSLPHGLDTGIGERGVRLSGGQRQRIGIARALYNDPEIMIFDEATSALDNDTETAIMEAIERLHGRKTLIIVAHRLTTIEKCDAVYRVEDRKFVRER